MWAMIFRVNNSGSIVCLIYCKMNAIVLGLRIREVSKHLHRSLCMVLVGVDILCVCTTGLGFGARSSLRLTAGGFGWQCFWRGAARGEL